ncbi:glycoside hydrolase family 76 protein [Annulohypoxylon truncatum]|uniref:glycoside hydrolase family 76 protein n=1 Tax=Annulohypoxylon truncatum TaxID=327061 RepID=UPI0020073921|nr:glycoside hydrolase family 76 protein [Annulohypoxylon truncatum]KAI1209880.1 glycoside hydrolase family 76 protein [Annulohypoxylon truncatum]
MHMKSVRAAALAAAATVTLPKDININDTSSIRSVASTLAWELMAWYSGNVTNTPTTIAVFPEPYYWWEAGAAWGAMLDYSHYTGDSSYDDVISQALLSQVGPKFDFMVPEHYGSEGNDDQAFWSFAILNAAERNFPQPEDSIPPWLDIAVNIWNTMVARWNTTTCGGGLPWQIFESNPNGMSYKNSVSNGGFFQMSARLARATGNNTYLEWAQKVWDWSEAVGFVDSNFNVYDGADGKNNCAVVNKLSFSYAQGIYLYGAAVLYNYTDGNQTWGDRTMSLLKAADSYFSPYPNSTNVMFEHACEPYGLCNNDMKSFKGYLSRFMWAATRMMPSTLPRVQTLLNASAVAAANACSGGENGTVCGQKWYVGGFDGVTGLGQQMTALETVQGLLAQEVAAPFKAGQIKHVKGVENPSSSSTVPIVSMTSTVLAPASTSTAAPSVTATPSSSIKLSAAGGSFVDWKLTALLFLGSGSVLGFA